MAGGYQTVTIGATDRIFAVASASAYASPGGALSFFYNICFRPSGGAVAGGSVSQLVTTTSSSSSMTAISSNGILFPGAAGTYDVGLCASKSCLGGQPNFYLDYGNLSLLVFR